MPLEDKLRHFDFDDLRVRWQRARASAVRKTMENAFPEDSVATEDVLLEQFFSQLQGLSAQETEKKKSELLRLVFDHSRLLGASLSRSLRLTFELQDFRNTLEQSNISCVLGKWDSRDSAKTLTRRGCDFCPRAGVDACNYWRESIDGLVMGLGESERYVRHASIRNGDSACIDVFYLDSDRHSKASLAWGPLPEHMSSALEEICTDFENTMKTPVLLMGINEGVLYFKFKRATDKLCGGGQILGTAFERKVQNKYPGLRTQEITPRAVLGVEK